MGVHDLNEIVVIQKVQLLVIPGYCSVLISITRYNSSWSDLNYKLET